MPLASDLDKPLYLSIYKLILYLYNIVHNLPKEYKYSIGSDIINICWKTLDLVILTNSAENNEKYKYILKTITQFNTLKYRLRILCDLKVLSYKRYAYIIEQSVEINRMLRGWLNWAKKFE